LFGVDETDECLRQILDLQTRNRFGSISQLELKSEGHATLRHSADLLKRMNTPHPHVVARDVASSRIVGYTLVLDPELDAEIPLLEAMFERINATDYEDRLLRDRKYFVMGQVCIEKDYSGLGVLGGLYKELKRRMAKDFEYIITLVSRNNPQSLRAHKKEDFQTLVDYEQGKEHWEIIGCHCVAES